MAQVTRDVVAERADIDRAVKSRTIHSVFKDVAERYPNGEALKWREAGGWQTLTWAEYRARVRGGALGLRSLGFAPGEFGLIMARNCPEHLIADLAITHAGGRAVSVYNTLAPEQIAYIANHCEAAVAFVEDDAFLDKFRHVRERLPYLRHVIVMRGDLADTSGWTVAWRELMGAGQLEADAHPHAFDALAVQAQPDDIVALIYTSGTTGGPKGVTYTHHNVLWTCESAKRSLETAEGERYLSYLPLAHVAERFTSHWGGIYNAGIVHLVPEPTELALALPEVRPTVFVGVPRVWEKLQTGIKSALAAEPDAQRRALVEQAIALGRERAELERRGDPVPSELAAQAQALAPVLGVIRARIGLDQCRLAVTSTAPIPLDVLQFFTAIGLPLVEVWGMSELTGPATCNPPARIKPGTVGQALPGVEAKLSPDGELLIRGGNVMPAYYKDAARTAEVFDEEGWLRTGDVATVDEEGYYRLVDRRKELIITSSGKNISPANIEALLKHHPLIGQAVAVGDGHQFISALVVLDGDLAPLWAKAHGIAAGSMAELAAHPVVVSAVRDGIAEANSHLSRIEQVKRFTILPAEWTPESEELTPTLKLKRRVIAAKYAEAIAGMYADAPTGYEVGAPAAVPAGVPAGVSAAPHAT